MLNHPYYLAVALNSQGITSWIIKYVVTILIVFVGVKILMRHDKGRLSGNVESVANVLLGCFVIAAAATIFAFADGMTGVIFK